MLRDRYIPNEATKANRRHLRSTQTKAEEVFWYEIRNSRTGYKFRRQVSIDNFIVDFYCHELRLVIELDGPIHEEQKDYDLQRNGILKEKGYVIVRYKNDEILFERERVMKELREFCQQLSKKKD